jgi:hypothetical protein
LFGGIKTTDKLTPLLLCDIDLLFSYTEIVDLQGTFIHLIAKETPSSKN